MCCGLPSQGHIQELQDETIEPDGRALPHGRPSLAASSFGRPRASTAGHQHPSQRIMFPDLCMDLSFTPPLRNHHVRHGFRHAQRPLGLTVFGKPGSAGDNPQPPTDSGMTSQLLQCLPRASTLRCGLSSCFVQESYYRHCL